MVFGWKKSARLQRRMRDWHKAYAWRPARLIDGRWVWLEPVERISYWNPQIEADTPHTLLTDWCFRLPEPSL